MVCQDQIDVFLMGDSDDTDNEVLQNPITINVQVILSSFEVGRD